MKMFIFLVAYKNVQIFVGILNEGWINRKYILYECEVPLERQHCLYYYYTIFYMKIYVVASHGKKFPVHFHVKYS